MAPLQFPHTIRLASWLGSAVVVCGGLGLGMSTGWAQTPPPEREEAPSSVRSSPLTGQFSVEAADRMVEEASAAIAAQDYNRAIEQLRSARQIYNRISGHYQKLAAMFVGIDSRQVTSNRSRALAAAQSRDQTSYQLALVYRTQNRPEEAIDLLMEILESQQPTRELGQRAYQQLYELGFVEFPFTQNSSR